MSQKEFLEELRIALSGKVSAESVLENIEYYRSYIEGEIQSGKSEKEVLNLLGKSWILPRRSAMPRMGRMIPLSMSRAVVSMTIMEKTQREPICSFMN